MDNNVDKLDKELVEKSLKDFSYLDMLLNNKLSVQNMNGILCFDYNYIFDYLDLNERINSKKELTKKDFDNYISMAQRNFSKGIVSPESKLFLEREVINFRGKNITYQELRSVFQKTVNLSETGIFEEKYLTQPLVNILLNQRKYSFFKLIYSYNFQGIYNEEEVRISKQYFDDFKKLELINVIKFYSKILTNSVPNRYKKELNDEGYKALFNLNNTNIKSIEEFKKLLNIDKSKSILELIPIKYLEANFYALKNTLSKFNSNLNLISNHIDIIDTYYNSIIQESKKIEHLISKEDLSDICLSYIKDIIVLLNNESSLFKIESFDKLKSKQNYNNGKGSR